jgi:hypothetical protein
MDGVAEALRMNGDGDREMKLVAFRKFLEVNGRDMF